MLGLGAYGLGITQAMLQGAQGSHTSPADMQDGLRQVCALCMTFCILLYIVAGRFLSAGSELCENVKVHEKVRVKRCIEKVSLDYLVGGESSIHASALSFTAHASFRFTSCYLQRQCSLAFIISMHDMCHAEITLHHHLKLMKCDA